MKLSFCTLGCPDWDLDRVIDQAREMGFDGVELRGVAGNHLGPDETPQTLAGIKKKFDKAGVRVAAIMGYSRFTWDEPTKRQEDVAVATKFLEAAKALDCKILRIFGGNWCSQGREESIRRVVESLKQLAPRAEKAGVTLALETHDDWCVGENAMAVLNGVNSPALKMCWDVANAYFIEPIHKTFDAIRRHIAHVHFKDASRSIEGKTTSMLPGTGQVSMKHALELLEANGYQGYLSFEWEKKWEPKLADPEIAFPHYLKHATKLMKEVGVQRG